MSLAFSKSVLIGAKGRVGNPPPVSTPPHGTQKSRTIALYLIVAFVAALYLIPFVRVLSGAPNEGIYLYEAQRVTEGAIPGREFIQENPPGAYYWLALFFRVFGMSLATARTVLLFTGVGISVLVFHLARKAGSSGFGPAMYVLATAIPLMCINSPHHDSNLFALCAFAVFLVGYERLRTGYSQAWPFVLSGALAGCVSCFLQQKGVCFLAAFVAALWIAQRKGAVKPCLLMIGSFSGVIIAEILPYVFWGALPDLFKSTVSMPLAGYHALTQVPYGFPLWTVWFPPLFSQLKLSALLLLEIPILVAISIPLLFTVSVGLVVAILGFVWRSRVFGPRLLPFWLAAYAMWLSESHRVDLSHLRHGNVLLVVLFFVLCERYGGRWFKRVAFACAMGAMLLGFTTLHGALEASQPLSTRRGLIFTHQHDGVLEFLLSHTRPGDSAFVYPYSPIYYFLADLRNPTRLNEIVDERKSPLIEEVIRDLEAAKPRFAVQDTKLIGDGMKSLFPAIVPLPPQERLIDRYLDAHYHQVAFENECRILERNSG